jgi:diguanylate cyclase (GGDEF)-like protein
VDLDTVLENVAVSTHFQPIVGLNDGINIGFEALVRGPSGTILESPHELFTRAAQLGMLCPLEKVCWQAALRTAAQVFEGHTGWTNLFINVMPEHLRDASFLDAIHVMMREAKVVPGQIVVEITEGGRIDDYPFFREIIAAYRRVGLRLAVDDAGAGHSGLQTIIELLPDFVKIDKGLVSGIDREPAKAAAVKALTGLTRSLGIGLIAEGIETASELLEVRRLGVSFGQGFFLGRPAVAPTVPSKAAADVIRKGSVIVPVRHAVDAVTNSADRTTELHRASIGEIAVPTPTIATGSRTEEADRQFRRERTDGLIVVDDERPLGLLMRSKLDRQLSRPYGREVLLRRPVDDVIDANPLIVDVRLSVEEVARLAMARTDDAVYDHVIVACGQAYVGTVSIRRLLETVTALKVASAKLEHPLTGLPGSPVIQEEIAARAGTNTAFGLMYIDLDNFKAFNDYYGFHHGDRAIRLLARILGDVASDALYEPVFLGHVGGDDFIAVVQAEHLSTFSEAVRSRFSDAIPTLYKSIDVERGFIEIPNRQGGMARFPIMTVTVATLKVEAEQSIHFPTLMDQLAEAKVRAKAATHRFVSAVA